MRIIDSNKDFYDFYQNVYIDNSITFDRRDSYNLLKEEFARRFFINLKFPSYEKMVDKKILLQICNTFWLFNLKILSFDKAGFCLDYELKLLSSWKDYTRDRELIKLSEVDSRYGYLIKDDYNRWIELVKLGDFKTKQTFDKFTLYKSKGQNFTKEERHIPILKNIGIASEVNPLDVYLSFEEYFCKEKTKNERSESIGLTDKDRILNHGFDLKSSFRGK